MPKDSKKVASAAMPADAARLRSTRRLAGAAMLFEQIWPTLFALASILAVFLAFAWFGLFALLPGFLRLAVLVAFAAAAGLTLWRARGLRLASPAAIDQRIESRSRLDHQPLQVQADRPTGTDPIALALWHEHQRRMALRLRHLTGGTPETRTERLDPYGLRAIAALLLVTAFAFSYGPVGGRLTDAFASPEAPPLLAARVDAWVTPPSYTGRAPIFLTDAALAGARAETADSPAAAIEVPEGSVLSVRVSDGSDTKLTFTPEGGDVAEDIAPGGSAEPAAANVNSPGADTTPGGKADAGSPVNAGPVARPAPGQDTAERPAAGEYDVPLADSGAVQLASTFRTLGDWRFTVTPDAPPTIAFTDEPAAARKGALEIPFSVGDDYGVRKGTVAIEVRGAQAAGARPLVPVPEITLSLPRRTKGEAKGRTSIDLTESPYAGAEVGMTLEATDDAGQTGRSETEVLTLPERPFSNPLARAVVEQRRILALDANAVPRVTEMLDAVTLRGEDFIESASAYLSLRAVRSRIANAEDDATLVSALDFMWQIALGIEDGNLSLAEKKLRDAKEKLADAIEKGADDAEIDKLMAELREAMQEYMQAMAEAMKNQPPMSQEQMQNAQEIRPSDIEKMMDRIEDLAKSGSKDAAQQLLSELQQMMDQMQAMQQPGQQQQQDGQQNAMRQQMDKLGEMLRQQQALKDKTYELGRKQMQQQMQDQMGEGLNNEPQPGEQGQPGEQQAGKPMTADELKQALEDLKKQQGQLQKDLQSLQDGMKGMGMEPGESLGEAGKAMGKAEGALGEGNDGEAVGQQGQAMEALRRGAKDMMQQMQQAMQQGEGQGQQPGQQGQMGQGFSQGQQRSGRDPLGRPRSTQGADFGQDVRVPDEIDTQRARKILDAIRNRLGDALSPQLEREYLERLLKTQ